jgi:hypothetical protein
MMRFIRLGLWLAIAAWPAVTLADEVKLGDDNTTGIPTSTECDARPYGYRVIWTKGRSSRG